MCKPRLKTPDLGYFTPLGEAIPANFDRHRQGDALIRQELQKLMELHGAAKPIVNKNGNVVLKDPKTGATYTGLLFSQLLQRAPEHVSCLFAKVRNRKQFGEAVHAHFVKMTKSRHVARLGNRSLFS